MDETIECAVCKTKMPIERLTVVGIATCINCTDQSGYTGFMNYSHKTAPEIVLIRNNRGNAEALRQARRANERKR
jgi:hypothetical protein